MTWWTAFALTQALEMPVYWWGTRSSELGTAWRLGIGFGASAVTHPVVWFVLPELLEARLGFGGFFVVAESFAVLTEALYLRAFGILRSWQLSLLANTISASVGLAWWLWLFG